MQYEEYLGDRAFTHHNRNQDLCKSGLELYTGREAAATAPPGILCLAQNISLLLHYIVTEELRYHYEARVPTKKCLKLCIDPADKA